ncbi:MAG TPA: prepilin-type N-terminal cleavage/methylation domain-containing protein [Verrucomicrobiae bacterium]|jgi:prepilin-type N-terminal cleavage/methylation domain-containing protein/prepilin-type processing-associated H-X9-DG protein
MKPRLSNQTNRALTLVEVLVVIAVLAVLGAIILPILARPQIHSHLNCVNNLKEICLAYRVWAGDNGDKYPMEISITNGGAMELAAIGDAVVTFQIMSNELSTPKILICPEDKDHVLATNFDTGFTSKNISYFVGIDADQSKPQLLLSGDDNFIVDGGVVKSGLVQIPTNSNVAWTSERHVSYKEHFWTPTHGIGNIGFADGSVQQDTSIELQQAIQKTSLATNRFAIP